MLEGLNGVVGLFEVDAEMDELLLSPREQFQSSIDALVVLAIHRQGAPPDRPDTSTERSY